MENTRLENGIEFAELIWWMFAKAIVKKAGELYKWNDEQWIQANEIFLRPNDYKVILGHE
jgi:hypothetical protein